MYFIVQDDSTYGGLEGRDVKVLSLENEPKANIQPDPEEERNVSIDQT